MWCTGVKTGRESQIPTILKPLTPTLTVQQHLTAERPGTDVIGLCLFNLSALRHSFHQRLETICKQSSSRTLPSKQGKVVSWLNRSSKH
ncbi:hypothetical protein CDAR_115081 [Caerostris darwini]|uniref:Uncharacterized protein n=1 Tax=Caerostris darwini TaxID=1538125 RepID=A0AAV4U078_9ARAC|nr:hypothetical protein CDAR_115081 [Caerostris darwini]